MLVSFTPAISNNKSQNPNFKSARDGKIIAEEVARYTSDAEDCVHSILLGTYKPTKDNLEALLKAKEIGEKDRYAAVAFKDIFDDAIEALKAKAKEKGINL